jgi:hypothetical protein
MGPPHFAEAQVGSPEGIPFPPMLFARNALTSGPQACFFAEMAIPKAKVGKGRFSLAGNTKIMLEKN